MIPFIFCTIIFLFVAYLIIDEKRNPSPWSWQILEEVNGYVVKQIRREEMGFNDYWEYRVFKNGKRILETTDYMEVKRIIEQS